MIFVVPVVKVSFDEFLSELHPKMRVAKDTNRPVFFISIFFKIKVEKANYQLNYLQFKINIQKKEPLRFFFYNSKKSYNAVYD